LKRITSATMLSVLFIGLLTLAFNIDSAKAFGIIYIRADGSIDPLTASVSSIDNATYIFTDNVNDSIVIEKNDIVVDGKGFTVQGAEGRTGIDLSHRNNVTVKNMEIMKFETGILLEYSSNNILSNNTVVNNNIGIKLWFSGANTLTDNAMVNNTYNFGVEGGSFSDFNNSVDVSNTVNCKPIYYLVGALNEVYDSETNAGTIYVINSKNITVKDLTLTNNYHGLLFWDTANSKIKNIIAKNNYHGVYLWNITSSIVENVTASNNEYGIRLKYSQGNVLVDNKAVSNDILGISISYSTNNTLSKNVASSNNCVGISLWYSDNNRLSDNIAEDNSNNFGTDGSYGICLDYSGYNILTNNMVADNLEGIGLSHSDGNALIGNNIENNIRSGIRIQFSCNNVLSGNNIENSGYTAVFGSSGTVAESGVGIWLKNSSSNKISNNNFINNKPLVDTRSSLNTWDEGYPSGGNYWSSCKGVDVYSGFYQNETGNDGIGDSVYAINDVVDRFPLMAPTLSFTVNISCNEVLYINVISNLTISDFILNVSQNLISINVMGLDGSLGFGRITVPNIIFQQTWQGNCTLLVDGKQPLYTKNLTDDNNTYIYFTYIHSERKSTLDFQSGIILVLLVIFIIVAIILARKKSKNQMESISTFSTTS